MTQINLLPWREERREQEKKAFSILMAISFISAALVSFFIYMYASRLAEDQANRNKRLQDEITIMDQQIAEIKQLKQLKASLLSRMMVIQNLQANRTVLVHLFDELVKITPDGVFLTQLKRVGDKVTITGYSESNTNVSILMRNIEQNPWIQNPELTEIKKIQADTNNPNAATVPDNENAEHEFNLNFILKPKTTTVLSP